jgi:hypothetical protein
MPHGSEAHRILFWLPLRSGKNRVSPINKYLSGDLRQCQATSNPNLAVDVGKGPSPCWYSSFRLRHFLTGIAHRVPIIHIYAKDEAVPPTKGTGEPFPSNPRSHNHPL